MDRELPIEEAKSIVGEGIHTALRKCGWTAYAKSAHGSIERMQPGEWDTIVGWFITSLNSMNVHIVQRDAEAAPVAHSDNLIDTSTLEGQQRWATLCQRAFENLPSDTSITLHDVDAILTWCLPEYERLTAEARKKA